MEYYVHLYNTDDLDPPQVKVESRLFPDNQVKQKVHLERGETNGYQVQLGN